LSSFRESLFACMFQIRSMRRADSALRICLDDKHVVKARIDTIRAESDVA
jgi:hypothetical protein